MFVNIIFIAIRTLLDEFALLFINFPNSLNSWVVISQSKFATVDTAA